MDPDGARDRTGRGRSRVRGDDGGMTEQTEERSIGKRANELNASIRYTMWSVFRLARPMADDARTAAAAKTLKSHSPAGLPLPALSPSRPRSSSKAACVLYGSTC